MPDGRLMGAAQGRRELRGGGQILVDPVGTVDAAHPTVQRREPDLHQDAGDPDLVLGRGPAFGCVDRARDDPGHDLGDAPDDVGVLDLRGAEGAHHRGGDVGELAQRSVRAPQHRDDARRGRGLARRMHVEIRPQVGLLLRHRLEQQPLLRREVAVDGAERDVGRGGDVAHLHRVEAARGRELQRRVEHPPPAGGLTARQRPLGRRFRVGVGRGLGVRRKRGLHWYHERNWNTF